MLMDNVFFKEQSSNLPNKFQKCDDFPPKFLPLVTTNLKMLHKVVDDDDDDDDDDVGGQGGCYYCTSMYREI